MTFVPLDVIIMDMDGKIHNPIILGRIVLEVQVLSRMRGHALSSPTLAVVHGLWEEAWSTTLMGPNGAQSAKSPFPFLFII
jgi:hypothetical protein